MLWCQICNSGGERSFSFFLFFFFFAYKGDKLNKNKNKQKKIRCKKCANIFAKDVMFSLVSVR